MSISISQIQSAGDYFRRTEETNELTPAKVLEAAALAIEDVHAQAQFKFTQRRQQFDYLEDETDYSILESLNVNDFREVRDVRNVDVNTWAFDYVDPNQFDTNNARYADRPMYSVEYRGGQPVLRISQTGVGDSLQLHKADNYTSNGTWAVDSTNSDATNLHNDAQVYRNHSGSIAFDIDVSQAASNDYAVVSVSDMDSVNLSSYTGTGVVRMWAYLPDFTDDSSQYVSSVELRWGSSSSAYWSASVTRPADHFTFTDRWNLLEFKWNEATQTGSCDESAIDYLYLKTTYGAAQTDDINFRINDIRIYNPYEMEMLYFSSGTVKSSAATGVWLSRPTSTSDLVLAPDSYKPVYVAAYNYYVASFIYPADDKRIDAYEARYRNGMLLKKMIEEHGERPKKPVRKLTPQLSWSD